MPSPTDPPQMTEAELEAWALAEMARAEAEQPASPPPAAAGPDAAPPADGSGRGLMIGMVCGYLLVGLLAASAARLFSPARPAAKEPAEAKEKADAKQKADHADDDHPPAPSPPAGHGPTKEPTTPDEALTAGRFRDALALARKAKAAGQPNPAAALQEGMALESLGRWKEAAAAYKSAADPDGDPGRWATATLGQARAVLAMDDPTANALISQVALRSGQPGCRAVRAAEEAVLLRARLTLHRLGPQPKPNPLDAAATVFPDLGGGLENYPGWVAAAPPHPPAPASAEPVVRVVPNVAHPDRHLVTADLADIRPAELLRQVAAAAGMKAEFEPPALDALSKSTIAADVDGLPLADLVAAVVEPLGLGWAVTKDAVTVTAAPTAADRRQAREALRRAVAAAPGHPRARAARLTAANLALADGRPKEATDEYRRLLTDAPHSPEAGPAARNLGLALLAAGDPTAARAAFLQSLDRATTEADAAVGRWWVGRSHLDAGDPLAAARPLREALNGKSKPARAAAAIGLAVGHLLRGDTDEAEAVLTRNPVGPAEGPAKQAAFLDSLIRFRGNPSPLRGQAVLAAARAADDGRALGPAGVFLAGQAYRDCGLGGAMAELYDRTLGTVRGRLAARMQYAAGVHELNEDRRPAARARLLAVAAADPDGLGPAAQLKLAELAVRERDGGGCLSACHGLLDRPGLDRVAVLGLMGRGYELSGQYRQAADCFAGRPPGGDGNLRPDHEKPH